MKYKYLVLNWKSGIDFKYLNCFFDNLKNLSLSSNLKLFLVLPSLYANYVFQKRKHPNIFLIGQNFSPTSEPDLIGETTIKMLKDFCDGVLINHWKIALQEKDSSLMYKRFHKALENDFKILLCINNIYFKIDDLKLFLISLEKKIMFFLENLSNEKLQKIILVFEIYPKLITQFDDQKISDYVTKVSQKIKTFCFKRYHYHIPLLFGTKLNYENFKLFSQIKSLNGLVFGRETWKQQKIQKIIKYFW